MKELTKTRGPCSKKIVAAQQHLSSLWSLGGSIGEGEKAEEKLFAENAFKTGF